MDKYDYEKGLVPLDRLELEHRLRLEELRFRQQIMMRLATFVFLSLFSVAFVLYMIFGSSLRRTEVSDSLIQRIKESTYETERLRSQYEDSKFMMEKLRAENSQLSAEVQNLRVSLVDLEQKLKALPRN